MRPESWRLASCTYRLPGPTITSTGSDALGAVGQRGDRVGASHAVDLVGARQRAGAEDHRIDLAVEAGRRAHGNALDTGCTGRGDAHHDRARIRRAAAGHVNGGTGHRGFTHGDAVVAEIDRDVAMNGRARDASDVGQGELDPGRDGRIHLRAGCRQLGLADAQRQRVQAARVVQFRVAPDRGVPRGLDVSDDRGDRRCDRATVRNKAAELRGDARRRRRWP